MKKNNKNKNKNKKIKSWWDVCEFPPMGMSANDKYFHGWATTGLYKLALYNKTTLYSQYKEGYLKNVEFKDLKNQIVKKFDCFQAHSDSSQYYILVKDDSALEIQKRGNIVNSTYLSTDPSFIKEVTDFFNENLLPSAKSKDMFVITQSSFGIGINSIGSVSIPIEYDNYTPDVVDDIKYSVNTFNSDNPKGRLLILNGPPGTGKTYLIRGLLNEIDDGIFVIVPSNLVNSLSGPQLIQPFLDLKDKNSNAPIYLIIEDADQCLVPRGADNLGDISSILNLTDGILGASLDLRILATTNAKKLEIDSALKRPGRLCKQIEVDLLNKQQANVVYKKITGKDIIMSNSDLISLAEIYNIAHCGYETETVSKNEEISPSKKNQKDKRIGFTNIIDD